MRRSEVKERDTKKGDVKSSQSSNIGRTKTRKISHKDEYDKQWKAEGGGHSKYSKFDKRKGREDNQKDKCITQRRRELGRKQGKWKRERGRLVKRWEFSFFLSYLLHARQYPSPHSPERKHCGMWKKLVLWWNNNFVLIHSYTYIHTYSHTHS